MLLRPDNGENLTVESFDWTSIESCIEITGDEQQMKNRPLEEAFEAIHDHIIDAIDHFLREKTVNRKKHG